jgi:predicted DsbA family dithiol-disulfide isomerase
MHDALFRVFFEGGEDIGKDGALLQIGASAELEREGLRFALEEGRHMQKVLAAEELAQARHGFRADDVRRSRRPAARES